MKNILLIGGFGFIGSNILRYIDKYLVNEYRVIVLDRFETHPHNLKFSCISKVYSGDFSDNLFVRKPFEEYKFDIVIHSLSATIPTNSDNIFFDIDSNLKPTIDLLNIMVEFGVFNIIYISSGGAIYGNNLTNKLHSELENVFPHSSYGIIKLAIEKYLYQYSFLYGISPLILRLSNPYGSYHYSTKQGVINVALRKALSETVFQVWGDGEARKDYIYIDDFCEILFILIKMNHYKDLINVGSSNILSVNDILIKIKGLAPTFQWNYNSSNKYDINYFELDISHLKGIIGDYSFTNFDEGLLKTLNWLKDTDSNN